tara:strand:- start:2094 stop:2555 length:462 start_codon:yes stop_codon:yes gene_type:complete
VYITKTNIQTIVEEVLEEINPGYRARRDSDDPKPEKKSRSNACGGRAVIGMRHNYDGEDAPKKRSGDLHNYEEGIEESEGNVLTNSDIEDFNLLARDSLAVIEDAGLIDQMRDMLPIQMRSVVDQKVSEFKSDLIEFIEAKMIDLVITREQDL